MNAADLLADSPLGALAKHPVVAKFLSRAPVWAAFVMVAIIAWQVAGMIWQLFPTVPEQDVTITHSGTSADQPEVAAANSVNVTSIINAHLFGEAIAEEAVVEQAQTEIVDAPETNLPLKLKGTLASGNSDYAIAIIEDGREEKMYRIDDVIRRGVTLHAVQPHQVILSRSGQLEALKLPIPDESATSRPAVRRPARPVGATQRASLQQTITNNAPALQEIISPRPYFVGGQQRGFRLYPSKDRQKFAALGLRPGDIVTEINGMPLTNAQQAAQVFSQLANTQSVTVMLERNGQQQSLTLDVNQLENATQQDN